MSFGDNVYDINDRPSTTPPIELAAEYFQHRGLLPSTIGAAGIKVVSTMEDLFQILGHNRAVWAAKKAGYTCAIVYPSNGDPTSQSVRARLLRPTKPDLLAPVEDSKSFKSRYLGMIRELGVLYQLPPAILPHNPEPHDVMLVEGGLQAMRLGQDGIDAIAISGVENFRVGDKRTPVIPEILTRAASAKRLIIALDSDQRHNTHTQVSINKLALELLKVKPDHEVYVAYPPNSDSGTKQGWDDFLEAKGRAVFDAYYRQECSRWDDNEFIRKCIEWQRYIAVEATGKLFDSHPHVFAEVDKSTADLTMSKDSLMMDPLATRVQMINFNHKHYLNSPYGLRATMTDMMPEHEQIHVKDDKRGIWVVNTYRFDLLAEPKKGDVSWWYKLIAGITPDTPSAVDKLVKLAAYKVQHPTEHLPLAIGIIGDQGAGKSLFAKSIGVCVGDFSECKVDMNDKDNTSWAGHLVREWMEIDNTLDVETWKMLVRQSTQVVRRLYTTGQTINARTLHIVTNNHIKQLVTKGDRVMIFAGMGKRMNNELGRKFFELIGEPTKPGPGMAALRYHLLYDIDTTDVESMDNRTELLGDIIEASQTRAEDVIDELIFAIDDIPGLEIVPSGVANAILDRIGYKGSFMSLRKSATNIGTPALKDGVRINNVKYRFCVLKNLDYWKECTDTAKYAEQLKLAFPLMNGTDRKF
jgi:Domain of unknown function (DUF3854)